MQVSYQLLKEYVDIQLSPQELADRLSQNGIVAEHSKVIFNGVKGVLVGEVKKIVPQQQNTQLSVCQVDVGDQEFGVICGAKNMKVGDYIPFAPEGAVLPGLGEIKAKKIQGFFSQGMICSAWELGLEKSKSSGVLILDQNFTLGKELNDLGNIKDDVIFDFEIFSNRPDLMGIIGIAREIAAFSGKPLRIPEIKIEEAGDEIGDEISVQVKDQQLCPRYAGRIVKGLKIGQSPFWLRWKLFLLGIRPINNIVDITNFVMAETGQPLHAFDLDFIHGKQIIVRRAYSGEKFITLDGISRELTTENLVIADQSRSIAIAGVMGGENSEISQQTKDIFLESAYFDSVNNRRTSRYLSLRTDASTRFEKGIDPNGQIYALNRAVSLISQLSPGKILKGVIDQYSEKLNKQRDICLYFAKVKKIIGTPVAKTESESKEKIVNILKRLEFIITEQKSDFIKVVPPSFRGDIQRDVDIIEEIAKIFGYDQIPSTLFGKTVIQKGKGREQQITDKVSDILVGCGMQQMISYSMITSDYFDWINLPDSHFLRKAIQLSNPLIQDQTVMRTTLIPGMLKAIQWNRNHTIERIKLFEVGNVFFPQKDKQNNQLPLERKMIAGAITKTGRGNIWEKDEKWDIFYLKGILECLFDVLKIKKITYDQNSFPAFSCEKNGVIKAGDQQIGIFGEVNPNIIEFLGIAGEIFLFELDLTALYPLIDQHIVFQSLPRYPSILRDIAIIVPEQATVAQISKTILEIDPCLIKEVTLFDVFRGKQVENGYKSIAFSIVFQAEDRTLTDQEVDKMMESVKIKLKDHFHAELRH